MAAAVEAVVEREQFFGHAHHLGAVQGGPAEDVLGRDARLLDVELVLRGVFAVEQERPDGSKKLRAIDNFSWGASAMLAEGDQADVLHGPGAEVRDGDEVELRVGVGPAEVGLQRGEQRRRRLEDVVGEVALALDRRDPQPDVAGEPGGEEPGGDDFLRKVLTVKFFESTVKRNLVMRTFF